MSACLWKPQRIEAITDSGVDPDASAADANLEGCPAGYVSVSGARYRYVTSIATWNAARADCANDAADGGAVRSTHLVVLKDAAERSAVRARFPGTKLWLGVSDRVMTGTWKWVTEENTGGYPSSVPGDDPWTSGEPDDGSSGKQDCAVMEPEGTWDDLKCDSDAEQYVCECDDHPEVAAQSDPQQTP